MSYTMSEEAKAAAAAYKRAWRAKNKAKVHEYNVRYWSRKAAQNAGKEENNDGTKEV